MHGFCRTEEVQALRTAIRGGNAAAGLAAAGDLGRRATIATIQSSRRTALQNEFKAATLEQAMRGYELAEPEERTGLQPLLGQKWYRVAKFQKLAALPVASPSP
jgi:hypothetical protein